LVEQPPTPIGPALPVVKKKTNVVQGVYGEKEGVEGSKQFEGGECSK